MADFYTQCPNMLIFGLPNLSSNDRMIMLSLIYLAWGDEEPLQISIRDLAKFNHLSPSVLCDSAKNEQEKQKQIAQDKFREGSLTRLSSLGYITVEEQGAKTYITVHLQKMWEDNAEFRKSKGVPNSNTIKQKGVRKSNDTVLNSNSSTPSSVLQSNTSVLNSNTVYPQNGSIGGSSDTLRTNNNFNERKNEESDSSIHSFNLSDDTLDKVREFAEDYGNDGSKCEERAQTIYQTYVISDDDFYNYLIEAYRCADKSMQMAGVFARLKIMLEANFKRC